VGEGVAATGAQPWSRVVAVGCSGSGKSTFARALAARLDAPWIELDNLYWGPGWVPRPDGEFVDSVDGATRGPRWVVDGNYRRARDIVWPRATALVWLNYGFATVFGRALRRTMARGVTRQVLWNGNRESLWRAFTSRDSVLWWVITSPKGRRDFGELRDNGRYPDIAWHEMRRPAEAARFLRGVAARRSG
jgi:adenylate kinase family enzyme